MKRSHNLLSNPVLNKSRGCSLSVDGVLSQCSAGEIRRWMVLGSPGVIRLSIAGLGRDLSQDRKGEE